MSDNQTSPGSLRCRVRALGITPGILPTGQLNAITDVAGVRVGHFTLIEGADTRTGATAILLFGNSRPDCSIGSVQNLRAGHRKAMGPEYSNGIRNVFFIVFEVSSHPRSDPELL